MPSHPIKITRTIYDPALKNFVFDSSEEKAMPNIKQWIDRKNPAIYWYILRIDNPSEHLVLQWAVELYTHRALSITEAYIDGIDRRFDLRKSERDHWSDKYILAIPKELGIPIVGSGARRIFFKVDVNCREGLMHEYGISGRFFADGTEPVDIREKNFIYSCKVGEFRQIFDNNPDEASIYAKKRLSTRYSPGSVRVFTNSFRIIHDLYSYCQSSYIEREKLLNKLHLLRSNFENIPEIANKRIIPLLDNGIKILSTLDTANMSDFKSRYLRLCDDLVELLHLEVVSSNEPFEGTSKEKEEKERLKRQQEEAAKSIEEVKRKAQEEADKKKKEQEIKQQEELRKQKEEDEKKKKEKEALERKQREEQERKAKEDLERKKLEEARKTQAVSHPSEKKVPPKEQESSPGKKALVGIGIFLGIFLILIVAMSSGSHNNDVNAQQAVNKVDQTKSQQSQTISQNTYQPSETTQTDNLVYESKPQVVNFKYKNWGNFTDVDFMGDTYFAGYCDGSVNGEVDEISLLSSNILSKVLIDTDDNESIPTGESLAFKEGYSLNIKEVDINGNNVWVSLEKDGKVVDDGIVSAGKDYI